ncbi:site-specific integrase [Brevibacillus reuszeri]
MGTVFAATTRARIISSIRQFFKWAVKQQYLQVFEQIIIK